MKEPTVCYPEHFTLAAIHTLCGRAMQACDSGFTNRVNYWGKTGIRKHKPIELLSFSKPKVTCKDCLKLMEPRIRKIQFHNRKPKRKP